jgi:2',3'-cyclic-nucleotide 2'-phosphodiesterase (5'-nucleotidase family)
MKTLAVVSLVFIVVQTLFAQTAEFTNEKKSTVVDNLNVAIKSDNIGLQTSGATVLSELISDAYLESSDASVAMIPLLKMLKEGKTDEERIAAAVALYRLGNNIGIYSLRGVALYDDNEKVASICKNLYYSYHKLHGTEYLVTY